MRTLRIFVMLPRHLDAARWSKLSALGSISEESPYGYHFAKEMGGELTYSRPTKTPKGLLGLVDKIIKRILGFDLRHAWNNQAALIDKNFDVVWTHTEYEHLGIAAIRTLFRQTGAPIIGQSVWLVDEWSHFSWFKKALYRFLLAKVDIATFLSPDNKAIAENLKIASRAELVYFGISLDIYPLRAPRKDSYSTKPIRVLAMGNDRHRDWNTLYVALGDKSEFQLHIGSSFWPHRLQANNIYVNSMDREEIQAAYKWADVVVVPLKKNLHASGITAILEAVAMGVPVVASSTGGLEAYFDDNAITYVNQGDAIAMRNAVISLAANREVAISKAATAQEQLINRNLTTRGFAFQHMDLSEQLIKALVC